MNPSQKRKIEYGKMRAAFEDNNWPVPSPQSFHHWTLVRQVDHLVTARETEPDLGFMARMLALCSLPRTNPGRRLQYKRVNGPYKLVMIAGADNRLPYGNLPRLLLAWVTTEAVRTCRRELILGRSLSEFMRKLDIYSTSGGTSGGRTRLRNQMHRLFNASIQLIYEDERTSASMSSFVADRTEFWWDPKKPDSPVLWDSKIELGEKFFQEIIHCPVPLNTNILKAIKRSPLGLDLYMWLNYRLFGMKNPVKLTWRDLYRQFGAHPSKAANKRTVDDFRKKCLRELKKIKLTWKGFDYELVRGALLLFPTPPSVQPMTLPVGRKDSIPSTDLHA